MSFKEKIDALDLIITALKEHEKRLDETANQLEDKIDNLSPSHFTALLDLIKFLALIKSELGTEEQEATTRVIQHDIDVIKDKIKLLANETKALARILIKLTPEIAINIEPETEEVEE